VVLGITTAAVPVLAFGAGKLWCHINFSRSAQFPSLSPLMAMYTDAAVAAALGEKYLRQQGSTALGALDRLGANERLRRAAATGCPIEMITVAQQVCREDFRRGRIHCIEGWVLAETELDVAALFTMK
jgi:hypothetical protein